MLQIPVRNGGHDFHDAADLLSEVRRHDIDGVGKILPRAGYAGHLGLTAEPPFRSHFAGDTGDLAGKTIQLIHHGIDGVLQFENFALHVHGDFP